MSLQPNPIDAIPEQTARVAKAAFPKGNLYIRMRDAFGTFFTDAQFADLFPTRGQPALAPWRLALVTIFQFAEGLSDRQAAEALRSRLDWKYALSLQLEDSGFDSSVLCEFRARLLEGAAEERLFETMLSLFKARGLLKERSRQRSDSTHVLAAIRGLNRLECIGETLRQGLDALRREDPAWLRAWLPVEWLERYERRCALETVSQEMQDYIGVEWLERYERRCEGYRLPSERCQRYALAAQIGADGLALLGAVYAPEAPAALRLLPAMQVLRQVWVQQFVLEEGHLRWRTAQELPAAPELISSPYDPQARYSQKRKTEWTGYKLHLSETCEEDTPNLSTDVQTTPATTSDAQMTAPIEANLADKQRLPSTHIVDSSYVCADQILRSQAQHGVDLLGPVTFASSWQAHAREGFDLSHFALDFGSEIATCPKGCRSVSWKPRTAPNNHRVIYIGFAPADCLACPVRQCCTRSATQPRLLQVRDQPAYEALQQARARQTHSDFKDEYAARAGIEGTLSQSVRTTEVRRCGYIGLAKTHLQHLLSAAALNLVRVGAWLAETPRAQTRRSPLAALMSG